MAHLPTYFAADVNATWAGKLIRSTQMCEVHPVCSAIPVFLVGCHLLMVCYVVGGRRHIRAVQTVSTGPWACILLPSPNIHPAYVVNRCWVETRKISWCNSSDMVHGQPCTSVPLCNVHVSTQFILKAVWVWALRPKQKKNVILA